MSDVDPQTIDKIRNDMHRGYAAFKKSAVFIKAAFTPMAPPAGPQMAQDPNAAAGAPAPADPAAAGGAPVPPDGGVPMPAGPGGAPADPAAAGGAPADPNAGGAPAGGVPPELQQTLTDLAGGVENMTNTMKEQQSAIDQLSQRQLESDKLIQELRASLKGPQPFEASAKTPATATQSGPNPEAPDAAPAPVA